MKLKTLACAAAILAGFSFCGASAQKSAENSPRIVNIINFIRQIEPRDPAITNEVLLETVRQQIRQLNQYDLPGTFLLQYDALVDPAYQELLKTELNVGSEIGAWWEITQPHVEAAGITWRGKYPWDWHANVGFATGYTPAEREKLVDVYMAKFREIYGRYPASVGSWFIDAHTIGYMYDKYGIVASCNCKDQLGTDGYTLWGGYWNQAYYPSRLNAYMPAQTEAGQIPVPIFRMLGSDPIYQYDQGLGSNIQGVISLEPVYPAAGGDRHWIEWFFRSIFDEPTLAFNYVQAGQENSFTWEAMKKGLGIQIPLLDSLRQSGKIRIETLETSGKWFKSCFPVTPATAVTALTDVRDEGRKTVWFNSRFYRANLFWEGDSFRFRDIHLFNQEYPSDYLTQAGTSTQCIYLTLPVVDGFRWSTRDMFAGLRVVELRADGSTVEIPLGNPVVEALDGNNMLQVTCGVFQFRLVEDRIEVTCAAKKLDWALELTVDPDAELPFQNIGKRKITAKQKGFGYQLTCQPGIFDAPGPQDTFVFRIRPEKGRLTVHCKQ